MGNKLMGTDISPRHLRVLIAVVETGGISKAAQRLLRAPSAITRSIHDLERVLSAPLFERQASGMLPIVFGDAAFVRAKRIANEFGLARQELAGLQVSPTAPIFSMLMTQRQLATIAALRELGHMPSVANSLSISQPAVSELPRAAALDATP